MEVEGGGSEADWTAVKTFRDCQDNLRAQQTSLEILANLCTVWTEEEDEDNWQDNPSDNEVDEEEEEEDEGQAAEAPAAPVSPVLVEAVLAHKLVSLELERANSLPENVATVLNSTARVN